MNNPYDLPFLPIRGSVYSPHELMAGFDANDPRSIAATPDFKTYYYFIEHGSATPHDAFAAMMETLHDNSILQGMFRLLKDVGRPAAAIMGGHGEPRGSAIYTKTVEIAKALTEAGFFMASGGGPGCMEATHLGALLQGADAASVPAALRKLEEHAILPDTQNLIVCDKDGACRVDEAVMRAMQAWMRPALELVEQVKQPGESLGVPTWYYGHEPMSPLATHVAKFFQNSVREDVLLAMATNGIIYLPGRAGTLQEVFQDANQNYYRKENELFAPMVFFGRQFWVRDYPVEALLEALFVRNGREEAYRKHVLFTDDVDEAIGFLLAHRPSNAKTLDKIEALGMKKSLDAAG